MASIVSIHAPVRVRLEQGADGVIISGFNPRTREGATVSIASFFWRSCVSIHAPVRVRPGERHNAVSVERFNPRTREGATSLY